VRTDADLNGIEAIISIRSEFPYARIITLTTCRPSIFAADRIFAGHRRLRVPVSGDTMRASE
jgi:hypothetical protein